MNTNQALTTITKGAMIFSQGVIISKLLGFLYRLIVARLGSIDYGVLSLGLTILNIAVILSLFGISKGIIRSISFYRSKNEETNIRSTIKTSIIFTLFLSIIISALLFAFADFISVNVFNEPKLSTVIKILAFIIPLDAIRNVFFSIMKAYGKVRYEVYGKNIAENLPKVILTFLFIIFGLNLLGASIAFALSIAISFIVSIILLNKGIISITKNLKEKLLFDKELITYSIPLIFSHMVALIILWTDTILIGIFRTSEEVGIYNVALPTANLTYMFPSILLVLFLPILTEAYTNKQKETFKFVYRTITKWIFLFNIILVSFFFIFSKQILGVLFGKAYITGSLSLIILSIGTLVYHVTLTSEDVLITIKKTKQVFIATSTGAGLNILLNIILIPKYGIVGAAIATSISLGLISLLRLVISYKITKILPFNKSFIKPFILLSIPIVLFYFLTDKVDLFKFYILIPFSLAYFLLYLFILLFTKSFEKQDLEMMELFQQRSLIRLRFIHKLIRRFLK